MNRVIVIGGDHHNTLGVIRSLGEKGVMSEVLLVTTLRDPFVGYSKYVERLHTVPVASDVVQYLLTCLRDECQKPVIICCSDATSSEIDLHFEELSVWFHLPGSREQGRITRLMNKKLMTELAQSCGLSSPKSIYLSDQASVTEEIPIPCIIKPLISKTGSKNDIYICYSLAELNDSIIPIGKENVQIQQFIDKEFEYQLIGCATKDDVIIPGFSRILRPCKGSNTSFLHYEPLVKGFCDIGICREFVKKTGYNGLFSLEFLRDKNGNDYFLEMNFRNDGNAICVTAAGVNLPYIWYLSCIGQDYHQEKSKDVNPVYVMPDMAEFRLLLTKKISFKEYLNDLKKVDRFMEYDKKDPKPFWKMLIQRIIK